MALQKSCNHAIVKSRDTLIILIGVMQLFLKCRIVPLIKHFSMACVPFTSTSRSLSPWNRCRVRTEYTQHWQYVKEVCAR